MKDRSFLILMAMGVGVVIGCKYMMCHPEAKKSMKETLKSATKKIYQKLDDME